MASTTESSLSRPSRPAAQPFLVPWDPDNIAHVERLFAQRKACGWNAWSVEKWRGLQREGEMSMHWIVSLQFSVGWVDYFGFCGIGCLNVCAKLVLLNVITQRRTCFPGN